MRARAQARPEAAFTLIEILMSIAIFAMVIAAIYATWTIILKSTKIGIDAVTQVQRERMAVRTIEQALMSARSFAADLDRYSFEVENGDHAVISFVARLDQTFPRSGKFGAMDVRRVTFAVEPGQNSERDLVLRQNPILTDIDEDEKEHPLVLARGVRDVMFEFWDGRKNQWSDSWAQSNTLPRLVKLTVEFAQPNKEGNFNYYSRGSEAVTRIIAIPTTTVPQMWQAPNQARPQPQQPGGPQVMRPGDAARPGYGNPNQIIRQ